MTSLDNMGNQKQTGVGKPFPLGPTLENKGVNFALYAKSATKCCLGIFDPKSKELIHSYPLDPTLHKTGDVWHISLEDLSFPVLYAYRLSQPYLSESEEKWVVDPRALHLETSKEWKKPLKEPVLGRIEQEEKIEAFSSPQIPLEDLILYEMHVRGFTVDPSSDTKYPGTYLGVIEKIPYLKSLGVNAVELMPIQEFHEWVHPRFVSEGLVNYWGYSPIQYFCPMQRFAAQKEGSAKEQFIKMVKAFHSAGIKVFIDVVYNHTGEAFDLLIWDSFCGIDRETYYMVKEGIDENFTGCGNTLNVGNLVVKDLIIDSLRYFAKEMGVDGFRFDLASILNRDEKGNLLDPSPLVLEIANDPILKDKILIAEPWDAAMAYQVGHFAKADPHWLEWNGIYRDSMRKFVRGDAGSKNHMATSLCGSEPTFSTARPQNSVNFITAHDGYSLRDLVSYERKHNEANLEKNHDGNNENLSWSGGVEGETNDPGILGLRRRQMKNFFTLLLISQGIPMLLMGDEYGHTRKGNNNPYPQDNRINWFQWDELEKNEGLFHFVQSLIHFRKEHPLLKKRGFIKEKEIIWHGIHPEVPSWNNPEAFLGFTLIHPEHEDLLFYSNATKGEVEAKLPTPPEGKLWHLIVDTFAESPHDFYPKGSEKEIRGTSYKFSSYSSALFKALS